MRHIMTTRQGIGIALSAILLAGAALGQPVARGDVVEELRQALGLRLEELGNPTPATLEYRRIVLQKKVDQLTSVGDLRRALTLEEWKDNPNQVVNKSLRELDSEYRRQVGARLTKALQDVVHNGDANSRLAAANSIAEMGPTIRSIVDGDRGGYTRTLTAEVVQLAGDKDVGVRQQALRALSNIFPKPATAVPVFKQALEKSTPGPKRLAADGMAQLIRVASHLEKRGRSAIGVDASRDEVLDTVRLVLGAVNAGVRDQDPQVRALSMQVIQVAAEALANLIPDGFPQKDFPPEGRKMTEGERENIVLLHTIIQREFTELVPIIDALREQSAGLTANLQDPESSVRLAAVEALENIGNARIRLKKRVVSVPIVAGADPDGDKGNRALLRKHDTLEAFLGNNLSLVTKLLTDANVETRRKTIEFLDIVEDAAVPALPLLGESLSDPDRAVRWSAARAITNIGPDKAVALVPGLAKLLSDQDLSIRIEAAKTLKEIGPPAYLAVPALGEAISSGDAEARLAALDTLQTIGPEKGKEVLPHLIQAMSYPEARVRSRAARVIGSFGPSGVPALQVLRHALGDEDQEVRVNASDAILNFTLRRDK